MTYSIRDLIDGLSSSHSAVKEMLTEHLSDNYGELLAHVFFGDIVRWVETTATPQETDRLLSELDHYFADGDEEVRNVIAVSFVEALGYRSKLLAHLGPVLSDTEVAKILRGHN